MDAGQIVEWLTQLAQTAPWAVWVLASTQILGSASLLATAVIKATPGKKDDAWLESTRQHKVWGKVWGVLESLSLLKSKS